MREKFSFVEIYLIIPILVLITIIIPLFLVTILLFAKKKKLLTKFWFRLKFGYLYNEYREEVFYWEFVKMQQKLLMLFIT